MLKQKLDLKWKTLSLMNETLCFNRAVAELNQVFRMLDYFRLRARFSDWLEG